MPEYIAPLNSAADIRLEGTTAALYNAVNFDLEVAPDLVVSSVDLDSINVRLDNPELWVADWTQIEVQRSPDGSQWDVVETLNYPNREHTSSPLLEGTTWHFRVRVKFDSTWKGPVGPVVASTDFMLEVVECKDASNQILEGALVIAVPAAELHASVSPSGEGVDWPTLSYKRCNRTDVDGKCSIRVPGGKGPAAVLMVPTEEPATGGDILAPVVTVET